MSRPTIRLRSERLAIVAIVLVGLRARAAAAAPADGESVGVAHVDVGDVVARAARRASAAVRHEASKRSSTWRRPSRTVTPFARSNSQAPRASRRSAVRRMPASHEAPLRRRDSAARPVSPCRPGPTAARSSGGTWRASLTNSSPRVLSRPFSPQRAAATCSTTSTVQAARPGALHAHRVHPRHRVRSRAAPASRSTRHEARRRARAASPRARRPRGDTRWKRPATATVSIGWSSVHMTHAAAARRAPRGSPSVTPQRAPVDRQAAAKRRRSSACLRRFLGRPSIASACPFSAGCAHEAGFEHAPARARRNRCRRRAPPSAPGCDRSCPGSVLISSSSGRPVASIMKSTRPQPSAPDGVERGEREARQVLLRPARTGPTGSGTSCRRGSTWPRSRRRCCGVSMRIEGSARPCSIADRVFGAGDPAARRTRMRLDLRGGRVGGRQVLRALDLAHADARALRRGLHDHRQAAAARSAVLEVLRARAAPRIGASARRRPARGAWCAACPCRSPSPSRRCRCRARRDTRARPAACRPRRPGRAARSRRDRSARSSSCAQRLVARIEGMRIDAAALAAPRARRCRRAARSRARSSRRRTARRRGRTRRRR